MDQANHQVLVNIQLGAEWKICWAIKKNKQLINMPTMNYHYNHLRVQPPSYSIQTISGGFEYTGSHYSRPRLPYKEIDNLKCSPIMTILQLLQSISSRKSLVAAKKYFCNPVLRRHSWSQVKFRP